MLQYWANGPGHVSISQICAHTKASKPAIYREFGSDDGLKAQALEAYEALAIYPFLALLDQQHGMDKTIANLVAFMTQDREALNLPAGCLFVAMRANAAHLGPKTRTSLARIRARFLQGLENWIDAMKGSRQVAHLMPTKTAAHQIDALHAGAMRMQVENVPATEIQDFLTFGLSRLRKGSS